jgi:hypothetical protein
MYTGTRLNWAQRISHINNLQYKAILYQMWAFKHFNPTTTRRWDTAVSITKSNCFWSLLSRKMQNKITQ